MKYWLNCHPFLILLLGSLPSLTLNVYLNLHWDKWEKQKEITTIKHTESQEKNRPEGTSGGPKSYPQPPAKFTTKAGHVVQTVQLSLEDQRGQTSHSVCGNPVCLQSCGEAQAAVGKVTQLILVKFAAHQDPRGPH